MPFKLATDGQAWALITGATSGIGAQYARELAARGFHLLLHGRREAKLRVLAEQLRTGHGIQTEVLLADLATEAGISRVEQAAAGLSGLRILVNNAGYGEPGLFHERSLQSLTDMQRVHNDAVVRITRAGIGHMVTAGQGAVINIASIAAYLPGRGNVMYYATKAFLNAFSRSLATDLEGTGVVVQSLCPGFTHTEFHDPGRRAHFDKSTTPRWLWMEVEEVVRISLARLGHGKVIVIPGLVNRIFAWIGGHEWLYRFIMKRVRRK